MKSNNNNSKEQGFNWDFIANSPEELGKIGDALFKARKQKHLDEQVQMTRLLETLTATTTVRYPLRVRHTGESEVPDFQLDSRGYLIAVEVAKIAVQDVEHARGLQQKELNRTIAISSLYRKQLKPRTKNDVIAEGFLTPQMVFPVSVEEHSQIWIEALTAQLMDKTAVLNSDRFAHGREDWLLLWDRIGTLDWEAETRIQSVRSILFPFWKDGWYSRVFLQAEHFHWTMMFTPREHTFLDSATTG